MYNSKIILFIATILITLAVALLVSFVMPPEPKMVIDRTDEVEQLFLMLATNFDRIPDYVFPKLENTSPQLYLFWREVCHMIATCFLIGISYLFYRHGNPHAPLIFFLPLVAWITYQESYLHPIIYAQKFWNGALDWCVWMVPFMVYMWLLPKDERFEELYAQS